MTVASPTAKPPNLIDHQYFRLYGTMLSWTGVHKRSQLKRQKLRMGSYMEEVLNYPHARAHPGCEVPREYRIVASSMLCQVQPDSGESCTVLQSAPTRSLIAKFPQHSVITCSTQVSCCRGRTLRTRPQAGVREPLVFSQMIPHEKAIHVCCW